MGSPCDTLEAALPQIVFFAVAPYERPKIQGFRLDGAETLVLAESLDERTAEVAAEADVVSVFIYSRVTDGVLARLPRLKLIVTRSTGFDHIDLEACRRRGVLVTNVPAYGEHTVAEHAFALLLALARKVHVARQKTRELDFSLDGLMGIDLKGKTLGVVGAGRIGVSAIRIAKGFGMAAIAHDMREAPELADREGFRYVELDELLRAADVVSLHAALTPATHHLIERSALRRMKPTALLINTARGALVDTEALCEALHGGWIAGAGLDVLEGEELLKNQGALLHTALTADQVRQMAFAQVLLRHDNLILSPHSAFFTREGVDRLLETSLTNIRAFLQGRPQNVVPGPQGSLLGL